MQLWILDNTDLAGVEKCKAELEHREPQRTDIDDCKLY